jgi:hypothetical protein
MGRARGLLLAGVAVVFVEAAAGGVGVILLGPAEIAIYLLVCAAATAAATALAVRLITLRHGGDDSDDDDDGGGGGDDDVPPWWPGFESDFWRYLRERERTPVR